MSVGEITGPGDKSWERPSRKLDWEVGLCPLIALCFWFPQRHRSPDGGPCPGNVEEADLVTVPIQAPRSSWNCISRCGCSSCQSLGKTSCTQAGIASSRCTRAWQAAHREITKCGSSTRAWWRTITQTHPWPQAWQIHPPRSMTKATSRGGGCGTYRPLRHRCRKRPPEPCRPPLRSSRSGANIFAALEPEGAGDLGLDP